MPLAAGTRLDAYEILGPLGAGGMGEVYRARDSVLKREVAIKVLPSFVSRDPDRLNRFEQEAQAKASHCPGSVLLTFLLFSSGRFKSRSSRRILAHSSLTC